MSKSDPARVSVLVPTLFEFDKLSNIGELGETARENVRNACNYILHLLSRHQRSPYYQQQLEKSGYYRLCSTTLKNNCGDFYKRALDVLLEADIIEKDPNGYRKGAKCNGYRLKGEMEASPFSLIEITGTVRDRVLDVIRKRQEINKRSLLGIPHLAKWFDPTRLTLRAKEAHNFIEFAASDVMGRIHEAQELSDDQKAEASGRVILKMNHQITAARSLIRGEYNAARSLRNERLHSILTSIKRELRSFLEFDGKPLVSLDLKASQPYLLTMLLRRTFYSKSSKDLLGWKSLTKSLQTDALSTSGTPTTLLHDMTAPALHTIMFPGVGKVSDKQMVIKSKFCKISWAHDFYQQLSAEYNKLTMKPMFRSRAKQLMMWILFEHRNFKYKRDSFKRFELLYPFEAQVVRGINDLQPKLLPLLLQRLESRIMLDKITKTISEELPECPLFTVHDSILTTVDYAGQVETIMERELELLIGLKPGITVEHKTANSELENRKNFAEDVFKDVVSVVQKIKKVTLPFSLYTRVDPLLLETPHHDGSTLFSAIYYDPNEGWYDDDFYTALEEHNNSLYGDQWE